MTLGNCARRELAIKVVEIRKETFSSFLEITKVIFPEPFTIILESKGGSIAPAFDWKDTLENYSRYGNITIYNNLALSSAAVLFMARGKGIKKYISSSSVLSFHKPFITGKITEEKIRQRKFYQEKIERLAEGNTLGHHLTGTEIREKWSDINYAHFAGRVNLIL